MDTYQAVYDAVRSKLGNCDVAGAVTEAIRATCDFSYAIPAIAQEFAYVSADMRSPSVLYRPKLFMDGTFWCALYGENLQDGVAGFGDSPAEAMTAFDKEWFTKLGRVDDH